MSIQRADQQQLLDESDLKLLRSAQGQLNWIAGIPRPEISYYLCELSTHIKNATIADIIITLCYQMLKIINDRKTMFIVCSCNL